MSFQYPLVDENIVQKYHIKQLIYKDSTTQVYQAVQIINPIKRIARLIALKIIKINPNEIQKNKRMEVYCKLMETVENSHVIKYYSSFYTNINGHLEYWISMEYCNFFSLDKYWQGNQIQQEDQKKFFISDIAVGLDYIYRRLNHQHLYLCPSNILISRDPASIFPKVKLSNFALCDQIENSIIPEIELYDINYAAPEYFNYYTHSKSDVWSFGVLIFKLLTGFCPFELIQIDPFTAIQVQACVNFSLYINDNDAIDLLSKMLKYDPDERISIQEVLNHPYIVACMNHKYGTQGKRENYKALRPLDHGQYGQVFLAENSDHTQFAVKEISKKIESLQREATCMRLCKHPNLVEYKDYFEWNHSMIEQLRGGRDIEGKYVYLVMEYCDAGNLEIYMKNKPTPLSNNEIIYFLGEICNGLWYLHFTKKLIHRDLKPANLLLQSTSGPLPRVKIADYGFSRGINDLMATIVGTPIYEAPEIIKQKPYTAKSDLYSLGVILYQMATKEYPFTDNFEVFQSSMMNELPVEFREDVVIDEQLKDLILHLITHHEYQRLSWSEFFAHPYVQRACEESSHQPRMEEVSDFQEF
ncbi:protein kinase domain containing protein [Entamoeba nuttalli P19]|uniref:Protein kinase domain containing protein n=1 Tax=Entamoeba nuttalli (strain P19) TaxID=1076696 RepID=K2H6X3_ENTNP|nr:protein kinase domain containing protein [Entamoeba nuttalli P19]EKE38249.1 protein kinase domain containing protein [Entamoeba nuttalli P19]|eukprot:XP_008859401.1 protein kinase domain containing protein [Entamoeba nuttalli P19]